MKTEYRAVGLGQSIERLEYKRVEKIFGFLWNTEEWLPVPWYNAIKNRFEDVTSVTHNINDFVKVFPDVQVYLDSQFELYHDYQKDVELILQERERQNNIGEIRYYER